MHYSVYDSAAGARQLSSRNGLFRALSLIGASITSAEVKSSSLDDRRADILSKYRETQSSLGLCIRGIKLICSVLEINGIHIRKRKCLNYVITQDKKSFYTDTQIIDFAKEVIKIIKCDNILYSLFTYLQLESCNDFAIQNNAPELGNCVQHIWGFQYECLARIVRNRTNPRSKKSLALDRCLREMRKVIEDAGYPQSCKQKIK